MPRRSHFGGCPKDHISEVALNMIVWRLPKHHILEVAQRSCFIVWKPSSHLPPPNGMGHPTMRPSNHPTIPPPTPYLPPPHACGSCENIIRKGPSTYKPHLALQSRILYQYGRESFLEPLFRPSPEQLGACRDHVMALLEAIVEAIYQDPCHFGIRFGIIRVSES